MFSRDAFETLLTGADRQSERRVDLHPRPFDGQLPDGRDAAPDGDPRPGLPSKIPQRHAGLARHRRRRLPPADRRDRRQPADHAIHRVRLARRQGARHLELPCPQLDAPRRARPDQGALSGHARAGAGQCCRPDQRPVEDSANHSKFATGEVVAAIGDRLARGQTLSTPSPASSKRSEPSPRARSASPPTSPSARSPRQSGSPIRRSTSSRSTPPRTSLRSPSEPAFAALALCLSGRRAPILRPGSGSAAMFDHIGVSVADFGRSKAFYEQALKPLGLSVVMAVTAEETGADAHAGFGTSGKPFFWIGTGGKPKGGTHVAFAAATRAEVDAFHRAALDSRRARQRRRRVSGRTTTPTITRAFVLDPDGNNIEAVCHEAGVIGARSLIADCSAPRDERGDRAPTSYPRPWTPPWRRLSSPPPLSPPWMGPWPPWPSRTCRRGRWLSPRLSPPAPCAAVGDRLALALGEQFERVGRARSVRRGRLRDRRVDLAPVDIGAEAAVAHRDRPAVRMVAEQPPENAAARRLGLEQRDRVVERQRRRVRPLRQGRVDLAVIDVGAEPALLDADRAALGMLAEHAPRAARRSASRPRRSPWRR